MAIEKITMPQLGESVTEGTISQWLVKAGDEVEKYDPLAEVMTDKVNAEIPSSFSGKIKELAVDEGETVAVGTLICYIEVEETTDETEEVNVGAEALQSANKDEKEDISMKKRYSPAVLRLAEEHGIQLEEIDGTGKSGRITRKDIEKVIQQGATSPASEVETIFKEDKHSSTGQPKSNRSNVIEGKTQIDDSEIPVTGVRKAIAANMVRSVHEIPHAWMMVEVDVTNLVSYRNKVKQEFKDAEGYNLTFFSFFVKAVAQALKEFPELNSSWAGDKIIRRNAVNISIAVANEKDLFVPVIKNADEKSLKGIARNIHELADKARNGKLTGEDMKDGTFTVNNTGTFGSIQSMGIINHPQAAILQVESIVKKPVIIDGMFAARDMVNLCLSIDHRVLDGLVAGRFLSKIKTLLEEISEENTSVY